MNQALLTIPVYEKWLIVFSKNAKSNCVQHSMRMGKLNLSSKWENAGKKKKTQKLASNSIHISVLGGLRLVMKGTKKKKKKRMQRAFKVIRLFHNGI